MFTQPGFLIIIFKPIKNFQRLQWYVVRHFVFPLTATMHSLKQHRNQPQSRLVGASLATYVAFTLQRFTRLQPPMRPHVLIHSHIHTSAPKLLFVFISDPTGQSGSERELLPVPKVHVYSARILDRVEVPYPTLVV